MTYRRRNAACGLRMQTREHIPLLILQLCVSQLIHNYVYIYICIFVCLSVCVLFACQQLSRVANTAATRNALPCGR